MRLTFPRFSLVANLAAILTTRSAGQQAGNLETEGSPTISFKECTLSGGCTVSTRKLTLDANWRHIHINGDWKNCYTGNTWDSNYCSDPVKCAQQCMLEQIPEDKYRNTYGIEQLPNGVKLNFVTDHQYGTNVGSRLYMLDGDDKYHLFKLKNREFAIDIDVSNVECGMNGAMYFVEMDQYGGKGIGNNQAGAKYGTGYCDAQCPHDIKFINGEANVIDWKPNPKDFSQNMGIGKYGTCCAEMDIWEANSMATAYTPHPCSLGDDKPPQYMCEGIDCGDNDKDQRYDGVCDKDGCDINPYRMGNKEFYGRGEEFSVNTLKKMTVVTQFFTTDGTDNGDLSEIRRFYVQDGKIIQSPSSTILGPNDSDSITDDFCKDKKNLFGDVNDFQRHGGMKEMGESLDRGHVMALSLWDDVEVNMLWLDSAFPLDKPVTDPGIKRGECPGGVSSTPEYLRNTYPFGYVSFENVAVGEIGSTLQKPDTLAPTPGPCAICESRTGQNTPECSGKTEIQCKNMIKYENKCKWTDCPSTSSPIASPTNNPSAAPTQADFPCCSCNFKDCDTGWCSDSKVNCDICGNIWLENGAQIGCTKMWNLCAIDSECCDGLACKNGQCMKACMDDPSFRFKNKANKDCEWIKTKKRLCKDSWMGSKVEDFCPVACEVCS